MTREEKSARDERVMEFLKEALSDDYKELIVDFLNRREVSHPDPSADHNLGIELKLKVELCGTYSFRSPLN